MSLYWTELDDVYERAATRNPALTLLDRNVLKPFVTLPMVAQVRPKSIDLYAT
jgi:hypothetical protein